MYVLNVQVLTADDSKDLVLGLPVLSLLLVWFVI